MTSWLANSCEKWSSWVIPDKLVQNVFRTLKRILSSIWSFVCNKTLNLRLEIGMLKLPDFLFIRPREHLYNQKTYNAQETTFLFNAWILRTSVSFWWKRYSTYSSGIRIFLSTTPTGTHLYNIFWTNMGLFILISRLSKEFVISGRGINLRCIVLSEINLISASLLSTAQILKDSRLGLVERKVEM